MNTCAFCGRQFPRKDKCCSAICKDALAASLPKLETLDDLPDCRCIDWVSLDINNNDRGGYMRIRHTLKENE